MAPFNRLTARGTRGVTLVASCTLRLPRRNCIGKLISGKAKTHLKHLLLCKACR